ncbi:MAG: hypothetical protein QOI78_2868 [Actinomycetota bacterium]|jgi:hypothetical protein|nr:hypothetical protein [Actinomycetota bacterium]
MRRTIGPRFTRIPVFDGPFAAAGAKAGVRRCRKPVTRPTQGGRP